MEPVDRCALCGREVVRLTKHHLIPQTRHRNKKNKKLFDRREVHERIAWLCRPCHSHVHATLTEKQLEREFNTLESLAAHPEVAKFVAWIRTRPADLRVKTAANRRKGESS